MISINDIKEQFTGRIQDQPQYYEYMLKENIFEKILVQSQYI